MNSSYKMMLSLQQAQCFLIANQNEIRVHLQDACRHFRGDGTEKCLLDDLCLSSTVDHHQHLACLHDGANAHGVSLFGHQIHVTVEETLVCFNGLLSQIHTMSAQIESLTGLVEADVTIVTNTQQLQVYATNTADDLIVALALGRYSSRLTVVTSEKSRSPAL